MTLDAIKQFHAVREFKPDPVPERDILEIINAGRRSQSSKNTQPWQFVVVRDRQTLQALSKTGQYAGHLAGAAFAVAIVARVENQFDPGQATAYMMLAAWELGLGSCIATIYEPERAKEILGVPAEFYLDHAISFGYPAKELERPLKKGGRQTLEDLVHWDKW